MAVDMNGFEHGVTWEEFQRVAERPGGVAEDALVRAENNVDFDFPFRGGNCHVTPLRHRSSVNFSDSWVIQESQTARLLEHGQRCFATPSSFLR